MSNLRKILEALPMRNSVHSTWTSDLPTPGTLELPVLPTQTHPPSKPHHPWLHACFNI